MKTRFFAMSLALVAILILSSVGLSHSAQALQGTQYGASMFDIASKFPDVSFAWGTSTDVGKDKGLKNIFAYEARAEEGGYVFGTMAAMMTKTNVLGVVGPVNAGDAKLYIDA